MKGKDKSKTERNIREIKPKTFPVPFSIIETVNKLSIDTLAISNYSNEEILSKALYSNSEGDTAKAEIYYQFLIDKKFYDPRIFSNYGVILQKKGHIKKAIELYHKFINSFPNNSEAFHNLGNLLKSCGDYNSAEVYQRKAIKINPQYSEAYNNLASILITINKLEEAEKSIRQAIQISPNNATYHVNLGNILRSTGNLKEAEIFTRKAIHIFPNYFLAHNNLGSILMDLGKSKEAELSFRKAININPNYGISHLNLGSILRDLGKLKEAELSTRKAIELQTNLVEAYHNLGSILMDLGRLKEAEFFTLKAIQIKPDYASAYSNLGTILIDLGKRSEAITKWIKAIELDPSLEKIVKQLAMHLSLEGKYKLAIKYLNQYKSDSCQSLHLGCLLSMDKEKEFDQMYNKLSKNNINNAEIGGIVEHANIIYTKKYNSPFCNDSIKYIVVDKIKEDLLSEAHLNQMLNFIKNDKTIMRSQLILKQGVQTSGNLFSLDFPFIKAMREVLKLKIEQYKNKFKNCGQGFINNWPKNYELRAWMIGMKNGGYLQPHNHEYGWITGSFYLHIPKLSKDQNPNAGCIAFSYQGPRYPNKGKSFKITVKNISKRDICIFPSSLFHHTIPFKSDEERVCFVFDLIEKVET
jgi:tetratricopeptide (TPR) repeat protein